LDLIKKYRLALEINTSGLDKRVKEQYPSEWISYESYKRKIPITIGSDAHSPEEIGRHFAETTKLLKRIGYKDISYFSKRERFSETIL